MGGKPGVDLRSVLGTWLVFLALLFAVVIGTGLAHAECGSVGTVSAVSSGEGGVIDEGRTTCR